MTVYNQHFKEHGGAVVNIIADMFRGFPYMSHTGAARAGVDNMTKYGFPFHQEYGDKISKTFILGPLPSSGRPTAFA